MNTNIALQARGPNVNPSAIRRNALALRSAQQQEQYNALRMSAEMQEMERSAASRHALSGIDPMAQNYNALAAQAVRGIDPDMARGFAAEGRARGLEDLNLTSKQLEVVSKRNEALSKIFNPSIVTDEASYQQAQAAARNAGLQVPGGAYSPESVQSIHMQSLEVKDQLAQANADRTAKLSRERLTEDKRKAVVTESRAAESANLEQKRFARGTEKIEKEKKQNKVRQEKNYRKVIGGGQIVEREITKILKLMDDPTNLFEAGFGSGVAEWWRGSSASTVKGSLNTIAANVAFGALQEMRSASKTGGALGAINTRELELLGSTETALSQNIDPAVLRENLKDLRDAMRIATAAAKRDWEAGDFGGVPEVQRRRSTDGDLVMRFDAQGNPM